jgi:pimeloyl-ACP methyl ester carboxylesterase
MATWARTINLMTDMHVVHDGPRQAPPLLLIHGSGATAGTWDPVVPALAGDHRRAAPDDVP